MTMEMAIVPIWPKSSETTLRAMLRRAGTLTAGRTSAASTAMVDASLTVFPPPGCGLEKTATDVTEATRPRGVESGPRSHEFEELSRGLACVEAMLRLGARSPGHAFPSRRVEGERFEHVSEALPVVGLHDVTGLAFADAIGDSAHPGGDEREARGERF